MHSTQASPERATLSKSSSPSPLVHQSPLLWLARLLLRLERRRLDRYIVPEFDHNLSRRLDHVVLAEETLRELAE
jgi:hypothetical protein